MRTRTAPLAIAFAVVLAPPTPAQSPSELREAGAVTVANLTANTFMDPIKCDSHSNIYFQVSEGRGDFRNFPVMKIWPDGKSALFPAATPEKRKLGIIDFAPTRDGVALLTTDDQGNNYLDFLDAGGGLQLKARLPADLEPLQMAVSPSGKVLVSGFLSETGLGGTRASRTFTGIFDRTGQLEQEVSLSDDVQPGESGTPPDEVHFRQLLEMSSAQASENGNFILARLAFGGPIHVISPDGIDLDSGFRPAIPNGAYLSSAQSDGNAIAAMSVKKKAGTTINEISDVFISLWDPQTRKKLEEVHHFSTVFGAAFACYKGGVFTFLGSGPNSQVRLVQGVASR